VGSFAVLGATSWGLGLGWILAGNGHAVRVLVRSANEAADVTARRGIARMPELRLPDSVTVVTQDAWPVPGEGLVVALPVQRLADGLAAVPAWQSAPLLLASKGIELTTGARPSEVAARSGWPLDGVAVLSGPNLSREVVRGLPAAAVVASASEATAEWWQRAFSGHTFRVYRAQDVTGVELAGAMKNVIAIAAGVAWGLGFGANTVASLLTRGLAEMARLGVAMGADEATYLGLAGVGDLAATCFSPLSRNRRFGELLAAGQSPAAAAQAIGETVEGRTTAPIVLELARRHHVEAPITAAVCAVLDGAVDIAGAMTSLLSRGLTSEGSATGR
jgi:glycerol-3-phosphate dehydrogenase (NAD(P)+)